MCTSTTAPPAVTLNTEDTMNSTKTLIKKLTIGLAAVAASAALVTPAFAASPAPASPAPTTVSAGGTGVVTARGTGAAQFNGHISGMVVDGQGMLVVIDRGGDAKVVVHGAGHMTVKGNVRTYFGFNGHARISGSNVTVKLAGVRVHLAAKGDGTFVLKGHGTFDTTPGVAGGNGVWSPAGTHGDL
jgi:hypothetical protein